jgi:putative ABC transport system permease protein
MFRYYLGLGFRSLRRNPVLTSLMVLTLSVGVAASMTTLTLLHGMSGDPIPQKSDRLFVPRLDNAPADNPEPDGEPPQQVTHTDAMALWEQGKGLRQTPIYGISPAIDAGRTDLPPFFSEGVAVGSDFFAMFDAPFLHGEAWSRDEDAKEASVVVIGRDLSERVFGAGVNPVGQTLRMSDADYAVVGVLDAWNPVPKFYRLIGSNSYGTSEDIFVPFRTAIARELAINGSIDCSSNPPAPGFKGYVASECVWIQYWVELDQATGRAEYGDYLAAYIAEQKALGRFPRAANYRLQDVMEWLDHNGVVSDDTRTANWLAFGFLLVCLVNTIGLLLAKFSARPGEIGVRRALGATRRDVFSQYLTEAGVIGLVGAAVGVALTFASLAYIRNFDESIALITRVDGVMLATAVGLSIVASLLAGLLPTWRACQVVPALQLKSQ